MRKNVSGFTIVELITVIVVIAVLASIVITAYGSFQERSKAAAISSSLKDIEKSLRVYAAEQKWSSWPLDSAIDPGHSSPSIQTIVNDISGFKQYLQIAPTTSDLPSSAWTYDYDNDIKPSCGSTYNGTNLVITGIAHGVADEIDSVLDDGDNNCGRVRYDSTASVLLYSLSYTNSLSL